MLFGDLCLYVRENPTAGIPRCASGGLGEGEPSRTHPGWREIFSEGDKERPDTVGGGPSGYGLTIEKKEGTGVSDVPRQASSSNSRMVKYVFPLLHIQQLPHCAVKRNTQ